MAYMRSRPDDLPWEEAVAPTQRILAVGLYAASGLSARGILVRLAAQAQPHAQHDVGDGADPDPAEADSQAAISGASARAELPIALSSPAPAAPRPQPCPPSLLARLRRPSAKPEQSSAKPPISTGIAASP